MSWPNFISHVQSDFYQLPVPMVKMQSSNNNTVSLIDFTTLGVDQNAGLNGAPTVNPSNLNDIHLSRPVFLEMTYYRGMRATKWDKFGDSSEIVIRKNKGWVVPADFDYSADENRLEAYLASQFSQKAKSRMGKPSDILCDRNNHYQVLNNVDLINAYEYLDNMMGLATVEYIDSGGSLTTKADVVIPMQRKARYKKRPPAVNTFTNVQPVRGYSRAVQPLFFAFRYVAWDESANNGKGDFIEGPLTPVYALTSTVSPFKRAGSSGLQYIGRVNESLGYSGTQLKVTAQNW